METVIEIAPICFIHTFKRKEINDLHSKAFHKILKISNLDRILVFVLGNCFKDEIASG